jgi:hypothetical protein
MTQVLELHARLLHHFHHLRHRLLAAIIVYFFLMESSQRTLEEVDTMYLTHISPRKSAKWDPEEAGGLVTIDNLYLNKGARNIRKRDEAGREGASHDEGLMVAQSG